MSTSSTSLSRAGRLSAPALDIQDWGGEFMRYALAIIFLWVGGMKFTDYEAAGIAPFVMNSPLTAWWHSVFGIQGTAYVLGVFEILTGLLLLARPLSALAFLVGALMSIVTYTITLSFLFTTPGVIEPKFDFPLLSPTGVFLLKDIVFLGVSIFLFGQALRLIRDKAEETRAAHLGGINQTRNEVQAAGAFVMRYGLALVFIWFALQKFTAVEADAIAQ